MSRKADTGRSIDKFLGGRITLIQPGRGHKAGLDAALVQAMVPDRASGKLVDLGCGCGTIGMAVAARCGDIEMVGLDLDDEAIACAQDGLALEDNAGLNDRATYLQCDVASFESVLETGHLVAQSANWVVMNPPFDPADAGRPSPTASRSRAHVSDKEDLPAWLETAARLLKPKGRLAMICRADQTAHALGALGGKFGGAHVVPVYPRSEEPAKRVLIGVTKGSRTPLTLHPGLILHAASGRGTGQAERLLRGEEILALW